MSLLLYVRYCCEGPTNVDGPHFGYIIVRMYRYHFSITMDILVKEESSDWGKMFTDLTVFLINLHKRCLYSQVTTPRVAYTGFPTRRGHGRKYVIVTTPWMSLYINAVYILLYSSFPCDHTCKFTLGICVCRGKEYMKSVHN